MASIFQIIFKLQERKGLHQAPKVIFLALRKPLHSLRLNKKKLIQSKVWS